MKLIILSRGLSTMVDDEDFENLNKWKWCAHFQKNVNNFYAVRNLPKEGTATRKMVMMHRLILNAAKGLLVDHKDGNTLNNQKGNIRLCTPSQNGANRRPRTGKPSHFLGVSFIKASNKWQAQIRINKKGIHLGFFTNEIDAAIAYNKEAVKYHGEFANLNIIKYESK